MSTRDHPFARNMDLVRDILIWIERGAPREEQPSADNELRFNHHVKIMRDAGFIDASTMDDGYTDTGLAVPVRVDVHGITWQGYELLAAIRNDTIWNAVKSKMLEHGLPMVLDLVVSVARGYAAQNGVPLG